MLTLRYAAKIYIVCMSSRAVPRQKYAARVRGLRHILEFYGYQFPLHRFDGSRILQYADIYDPYDIERPAYRERGQTFWNFVHWMKKNGMIPAFTAVSKK